MSQKKYAKEKAAIKDIVQVSDTTEVPQRISFDFKKKKKDNLECTVHTCVY